MADQSVTFAGVSLDPVTNTRWNFDRLSLPMTALPYGGGIVPSTPFAPASGPGTVTMDAVIRNPTAEALFEKRNDLNRLKLLGFQRLTLRMQGEQDDDNPELWVIARMVGEPIEVPNESGVDAMLLRFRLQFEAPDPRWRSDLDYQPMMKWGEVWRFESGGERIPEFLDTAEWKWLEADDVDNSGWEKVEIDGVDEYGFVPVTNGTTWTVMQWILESGDDETIPAWRFTNTDGDGVVICKVEGKQTAAVMDGADLVARASWAVDPENGYFLRRGRSREFWANVDYSDPRFMVLMPGESGVNSLRLESLGGDFANLRLYYRYDSCFV